MPLPQVKTGDLIAAQDWNRLVDTVNNLETTLANLSDRVAKQPAATQEPIRIAPSKPEGGRLLGDRTTIFIEPGVTAKLPVQITFLSAGEYERIIDPPSWEKSGWGYEIASRDVDTIRLSDTDFDAKGEHKIEQVLAITAPRDRRSDQHFSFGYRRAGANSRTVASYTLSTAAQD